MLRVNRVYKFKLPLQCCDKAKLSKVVYLEFDHNKYPRRPDDGADDADLTYKGYKPSWFSTISHAEFEFNDMVEVNACPFCKSDVPDVELNPNAIDEHIHDGDHDYCNTCGERLSCCDCLPPMWRWKPVGADIIIPERDLYKDDDEDEDY
jgi:hypothetical protein